jgi:outer membrane immunogenic protein
MKSMIIATAAVGLAGMAAPALAQTMSSPQGYAGLGYTGLSPNGHDLGEITGRMGLKLSPYWGVEAEVGTGVSDSHFTSASGSHDTIREQPSGAAYVVGYYPVTPKFDVLARVGYGATDLKTSNAAGDRFNTSHSVNYGAGAQYFLDGKNGVRVDYTRRDFQEATAPRDTDTWAVGYVHRF